MRVTGLIPARFLTISAHLVLLITIILERDMNVKACLPLEYLQAEYDTRDAEFMGGLIGGIALTVLEFLGFVTGITMFAGLTTVISILCHAGASISLAYMVMDIWDCRLYWWIFGLTSALPSFIEVVVIFEVLILKKNV